MSKLRTSPGIGSPIMINGVTYAVRSVKLQSVDPVSPPGLGLVLVYPAADGWRWHLTRKSRVLCDSGQSFGDRRDAAVRSAERVFVGLYPIVTVMAS